MSSVIETSGITKLFGKKLAVDHVSLSVAQGSIFAFLGPNGAGKTTTIKMLMNILAPTEGSARVLDTDSTVLSPPQFQQIGYVSENQKLPEWMTVGQFMAYCKPMYPTWDDAFCARLMKEFDLPATRKLRHLSRGMKTKAALLSSLAYRPRLLVLDEPFSGLDPLVRDEFIRGVLELTQQENWTVFVSSHDIDEVERLADWVGIINDGRMELVESVAALQARFQRMEIVTQSATPLPLALPPELLVMEQAGHTVRFVDSAYGAPGRDEALKAMFPGATGISAAAMSLRDIFLALARTYRLGRESAP